MLIAAITLIVLAVAAFWVPMSVRNYLNRPDTALRSRMASALTEKLGEPVTLDFGISGVTFSFPFSLTITFSNIEISSPTLKPLGAVVREAVVDLGLLKSAVRRKLVIEKATLRIPSLTYAPGPRGLWPHEILIKTKNSEKKADRAPGSVPPGEAGNEGDVDIARIVIEVDDVLIRPKPRMAAQVRNFLMDHTFTTGALVMHAGPVRLEGLPTFSALASVLNAIADAVGILFEGPAGMAGKFIDRIAALLGKSKEDAGSGAVAAKGTTDFDRADVAVNVSRGMAMVEKAEFSNSEMTLNAVGRINVDDGGLDMVMQITFHESGLKNFSSSIVREIFSDGVAIPIRGTVMDPEFDKGSFIKSVAGKAGKKIRKLGMNKH